MKYLRPNIFPLIFLALLCASCDDNCCTLGVVKECEGDAICADYATWEECRAYLESLSYNCD